MAPPTTPRNLVRLAAASGAVITLFAIWLWWFKGGVYVPVIPLLRSSKLSVTLAQGTYVGVAVKSDFPQTLEQFLGIPYGQSTAGESRFKPPVAIGKSKKVFRALKYGNRCPGGTPDDIPQTEDCLNLNIYRPKDRGDRKLLPVLVHIHGGSFNFGFGHNREIANMVGWSAEPFIGVSFNYRIGAFGFLPSGLTAAEGLLNAGLKDQALLLEWVQENIASFGGNPGEVTIMGSSAGAHSVGHHLMRSYNLSGPPFHKAILESSATTARVVYPPTHALHEEHFESFISRLGLSSVPKDQLISKLRDLDTFTVKAASEAIYHAYNPSIRWPFQPVIDGPGGMIPIPPIDAWKAGTFAPIPILTGFNTNEGAMFVPRYLSTDQQFVDFFHTLLPGLLLADLQTLAETYLDPVTHPESKYLETRPADTYLGAQFKRIEQAYAHFAYVAPVRETAKYAASKNSEPVYLYRFAVNGSVVGGADHGDQNDFSTYVREVRERSETLGEVAGSMHAYWTSFITRGDPNYVKGRYAERPMWPAYKASEPSMLVFGEGNDEHAGGGHKGTAVSVADNSWALEECTYWSERRKLFES